QGRTDNSWGPRVIGDHGAPVSLPKLKKAYEKGTRGISWGPLLTPGPRGSARVSKWSVHPCSAYKAVCLQWKAHTQHTVKQYKVNPLIAHHQLKGFHTAILFYFI
ncbi:unnamed protein product, partial [Staurois parvus]